MAADSRPAGAIGLVGTIKWRADQPVTAREARRLAADAARIPALEDVPPLAAICPAGARDDAGFSSVWTADDLLEAWRTR